MALEVEEDGTPSYRSDVFSVGVPDVCAPKTKTRTDISFSIWERTHHAHAAPNGRGGCGLGVTMLELWIGAIGPFFEQYSGCTEDAVSAPREARKAMRAEVCARPGPPLPHT